MRCSSNSQCDSKVEPARSGEASASTATSENAEALGCFPTGIDQDVKNENEGADPPRFSPDPTCHVLVFPVVRRCRLGS